MDVNAKISAARAGVVVLCGGPGGEREVSLASGENAHQALNDAGLANELIRVPAENPDRVLENIVCRVAVMMFHGEFGEGGHAQRILERRGIAFTGSDSRSCALSMDKNASKELFVRHGIPTSPWAVGDGPERVAAAVRERGLAYPLFAKPNFGGSSVGVSRVNRPEELAPAVEKILEIDRLALVEEMVVGREMTVSWFDGRVLPIVEMKAEGVFYDYHAKYKSDATRYTCPAELDGELTSAIQEHVAKAVDILGARDVARVDLMLGADGPRFLELNSLPGFTSHSLLPMAAKAAGIPLSQFCLSLVSLAAGRAGIVAEGLCPPLAALLVSKAGIV